MRGRVIKLYISLQFFTACAFHSTTTNKGGEEFKLLAGETPEVIVIHASEKDFNNRVFGQRSLKELTADNYNEEVVLPATIDRDPNHSCFMDGYAKVVNYYDPHHISSDGERDRDLIRAKIFEEKMIFSSRDRKRMEHNELNSFLNFSQSLEFEIKAKTCFQKRHGQQIKVLTEKILSKDSISEDQLGFVYARGSTVGRISENDNVLLLQSLIKARVAMLRMIISDELSIETEKKRIDKSEVLIGPVFGISSVPDQHGCRILKRQDLSYKECRVIVKMAKSQFLKYRNEELRNKYHVYN